MAYPDWVDLQRDHFDGSCDPLIEDDPPGVLTVSVAPSDLQLIKNGTISGTIMSDRGVGVYAPALSHGSLLRRWSGVVESISAAGWCHAELILYGVTDGGEPRNCDARIELGRGTSYGVPYYTMNLSLSAGITHLFNQLINPAPWSDADLPIRLYIAEVAASAGHLRFQFLWLKTGSSSPQLIADTGEKTTPGNWGGSRIGLFVQNADGAVRFSELLTEVYGDICDPYLAHLSPAAGVGNVDPATSISLDAVDAVSGLHGAATNISLMGVPVVVAGVAQPGCAVAISTVTGGYRYQIQPQMRLPQYGRIDVRVHAEDIAGHTLDQTYTFWTGRATMDNGSRGSGEWCTAIGSDGDYIRASRGDVERDYSVLSRARMRLCARRGEYLYDPELGSLFHKIRVVRGDRLVALKKTVLIYATEALQPLISEGALISVEVGQLMWDHATGFLGAEIFVHEAGTDERVSLGTYRIGG